MANGHGIVNKLNTMTGANVKTYFILWKYAPELLPKKGIVTFEDLTKKYDATFKSVNTEEYCNEWLLMDERVQDAVSWLKARLHQNKMFELYDMLYEKAKNEADIQAFKALTQFGKDYFNKSKSKDDVSAILQGVVLPEDYEDSSD